MELNQGKSFEKPTPGMYLATLVDMVDMPNVQTAYGIKNKIRFHWILSHLNGQPYLGKDGTFIEAVAMYNASMGTKAELPKRLTQILGQAPPVITSTEQLEQIVIGRSNLLVLVQTPNPQKPNDPFINVDGIGPIQAGMPAAPAIPANYVRFKNRPKTVVGPQGQPVQTFATPQAAAGYPAQAPVAAPAGYPAPAPAAYPTNQPPAAYAPPNAAPGYPAAAPAGYPAPAPAPAGQPVSLNAPASDPTRPF